MAKTQNKAAGAKTAGKNKKFKKRERKNVPFGLVFIQASFNNTIVTITDQAGNTLSWKSSGSLGFRGSRKGTPFAAQQAATGAANASPRSWRPFSRCARLRSRLRPRVRDPRSRHHRHRGPFSIRDVTPMPHNGCRPPKRRRV